MTRILLAATALGTLTGLLLTFGTGGAVGVAVCAGAVVVWFGVRAVGRERDKARHPSSSTVIVRPAIDYDAVELLKRDPEAYFARTHRRRRWPDGL